MVIRYTGEAVFLFYCHLKQRILSNPAWNSSSVLHDENIFKNLEYKFSVLWLNSFVVKAIYNRQHLYIT